MTGQALMQVLASGLLMGLIYALVAWGLERIVWLIFYRPSGPVVGTTQTTTSEHRTKP